jgi:N-acetylglucosamine malate deacetylase 1
MAERVLVLAPHPDDETIGCGGTLCQHIERKDSVEVVFLTSGELGLREAPKEEAHRVREAEAHKACAALGISKLHFLRLPDWELNENTEAALKALTPVLERANPTLIYLPHPQESHPDHAATLPLTLESCEKANLTGVKLFTYEVWSPFRTCDSVVDISSYMDRKLEALSHYVSQLNDRDYIQATKGLGAYRAALWKRGAYAEAFGIVASDQG